MLLRAKLDPYTDYYFGFRCGGVEAHPPQEVHRVGHCCLQVLALMRMRELCHPHQRLPRSYLDTSLACVCHDVVAFVLPCSHHRIGGDVDDDINSTILTALAQLLVL